MRIIYLHQYFNTPEMTGSTRSYEMAKRLVSMGHEVNMITSWREKSVKRNHFRTSENGIKTFWIPVYYSNHMGYNQRIEAFAHFAWKASILSTSIPTDIIFATSTPLTIAIPGVYASWRRRVPMVLEVRDVWPELPIAIGAIKNPVVKFIAKLLEKFAYINSAAIIALSPGMKDSIEKKGYPEKKITIIPNSADLENIYPDCYLGENFRKKNNIPSNAILAVYAGTFGKVNWTGYIVELADAMKKDDRIYFLTVGDGLEFKMVKQLALKRGCLGKNMQMLPPVPKKRVNEILSAADISLSTVIPIPELEANSANKFFDGLSAGCCTVINHKGWQAELLSRKGAGFNLSADIRKASIELTNWLDNPKKIKIAKRNARILAENEFDRSKLAKNLEQVLIKVRKNFLH